MTKYSPLPYNLTISNSSIHGLGLRAKFEIKSNEKLGLLHVYLNNDIIRTPLAGFLNHSNDPNCIKIISESDTGLRSYLYTKREIKCGEELTITYDLYKP